VRRHVAPPVERGQEIGRRRRGARRQQVALRQQRARLRHLPRAAAGDEHPCEPRVERQSPHLFADRRQPRRRVALNQAKPCEQRERRVGRARRRRLEPLEGPRIAAPRDNLQRRAGEIDPVDVWLAMRAQPIARVPQPPYASWRHAAGAAGALIRGIGGDALGFETVDAALGVITRHLLQPAVDDRRDAGNGHRCLREIGRDDDAPARRWTERALLLVGVERAVQRQHLDLRGTQRDVGDGASNLRCAGQEAQDVAAGGAERLDRGVRHRLPRRVCDVDRMRTAGDVDHRAEAEKRRHRAGIERRRHDDDAKVLPRAPRLPRERDGDVGVDAALVELVEHDRTELGGERIALQPRRQHAFGDDEEPRLAREAALEADLPADLAAERPAALGGNPRGDRARRDATRLQQNHGTVADERRRHARRLAGAWRGGHHRGARAANGRGDRFDVRIDWKRVNCSRPRAAAAARRARNRRGRGDTRPRASCSSAGDSPRRARTS